MLILVVLAVSEDVYNPTFQMDSSQIHASDYKKLTKSILIRLTSWPIIIAILILPLLLSAILKPRCGALTSALV